MEKLVSKVKVLPLITEYNLDKKSITLSLFAFIFHKSFGIKSADCFL
jgi:hypothetical protein